MRFTIAAGEALSATRRLAYIPDPGHDGSAGARIEASDGAVTFTTQPTSQFQPERGAWVRSLCELPDGAISQEGDAHVPTRKLIAALSGFPPDDEVEFVADPDGGDGKVVKLLTVGGGLGEASIAAAGQDDLPEEDALAPSAEDWILTLAGEDLAALLDPLLEAVHADVTNPLASVCASGRAGHPDLLFLAATDTYRLCQRAVPAAGVPVSDFLLPALTMKAVRKAAGDKEFAEEEWTVRCDARRAIIGCGAWTVRVPLVTGKYPNYLPLLKEDPAAPRSQAESAFGAARLANCLAAFNDGKLSVRITADGQASFESDTSDGDSITSRCFIEHTGGDVSLLLNGNYFGAALRSCGDDPGIEWGQGSSPSRFQSLSGGEHDVFLVMSMRA